MFELFGLKMWNVLDIFKFYIICCRDVTWCHLHLVELGSTTRCWSGIHLVLLLCRTLSYSVSHQTSPGNTKSWSVSTLCLSGNSLSVCPSVSLSAWMWVTLCRSVLVCICGSLTGFHLVVGFLSLFVTHGLVGSKVENIAFYNYWHALLQVLTVELLKEK